MDEVKQLVARTFVELGAKDVFNLRETLFLENGRCLAVAYRADDLSAVWCCAGSGSSSSATPRENYCGH